MSHREPYVLLMVAVFMVALGYGMLLPALPAVLGQALGETNKSAVAWHTGMLSGVYMFALFLLSPVWGTISDRVGRKLIILIGMAGYVASMAILNISEALWATYLSRVLSGAFASAVLPVTAAYVSDVSSAETRVRWFALMGGATLGGFLIGPSLFGIVNVMGLDANVAIIDARLLPFAVSLLLGLPWWIAAYRLLPHTATRSVPSDSPSSCSASLLRGRLPWLFLMGTLVTYGLGSFEVGIALEGRHGMGLTPQRVSLMFVECSLVMGIVQAALFFWPSLQRLPVRYGVAPGFLAMAIGFAMLPTSTDSYAVLLATALTAGGSGALLPALPHLASVHGARRSGAVLGLQSSASSLGQAIGSVSGGWLFGALMTRSFWITAAVMLGAAILAAGVGPAKEPVPLATTE